MFEVMIGNTTISFRYRIHRDLYIVYAGADGLMLHENEKFIIEKMKHSLLSKSFVPKRQSCQLLDISQDIMHIVLSLMYPFNFNVLHSFNISIKLCIIQLEDIIVLT